METECEGLTTARGAQGSADRITAVEMIDGRAYQIVLQRDRSGKFVEQSVKPLIDAGPRVAPRECMF